MSSGPSHRRGQVVDDTILQAVIDVIAADGTLAVKVDDVAAKAGVNKTTIYRRYPNRDDLVLAAVLSQAEVAVPIPDLGDLRADLTAMVAAVAETVTSPLGGALLSAAATSPELDALRPAYWQQRFAAAAEIIDRAAQRGQCSATDDAALLVELTVAPIHFRASQTGGPIDEAFLARLVDRLLASLT